MRPFPHRELARLAAELKASDTVEETVEQITGFAAQTFGTRHAGLTLIEDGGRRFRTAGPTDPVVRTAADGAWALNVYGPTGHEFTREDLELGQVLAQQASVALRFSEKIEGLTAALDSRTLIGQAQGVLIERYRVDADRAFDIMKRFSQDQNIRLAEIARRIVADAVPED